MYSASAFKCIVDKLLSDEENKVWDIILNEKNGLINVIKNKINLVLNLISWWDQDETLVLTTHFSISKKNILTNTFILLVHPTHDII